MINLLFTIEENLHVPSEDVDPPLMMQCNSCAVYTTGRTNHTVCNPLLHGMLPLHCCTIRLCFVWEELWLTFCKNVKKCHFNCYRSHFRSSREAYVQPSFSYESSIHLHGFLTSNDMQKIMVRLLVNEDVIEVAHLNRALSKSSVGAGASNSDQIIVLSLLQFWIDGASWWSECHLSTICDQIKK